MRKNNINLQFILHTIIIFLYTVLLINSIILNKWPLQVSLYYSKKAKVKLDRIINEYKPPYFLEQQIANENAQQRIEF